MRRQWTTLILGLGVLLAASPVVANTSEAQGTVEDVDGNPIAGAIVRFVNTTSSAAVYEVKTDKKGKYFVPNLLYYPPGKWHVTVEAEGFEPRKIKVESRKSDRTLLGEYETGMVPEKPAEIMIAGFGKAQVDFVMVSEAQIAAERQKKAEEQAAAVAVAQAEADAEAAETDPFNAAKKLVANGDLEGSTELFQKAIELDPAETERRVLYAKVLYNLERYREAEAVAQETASLDPDLGENNLVLADVLIRQERLGDAVIALDRAAAAAPDDIRVYQRRAWIAEQSGDIEAAIAANEKIVALDATNLEAWLALGDFYASKGDNAKATAAFNKVVELDPDNAYKTFYNIGVLIENKEEPSEAEERRAVEAFRKAVEIKPDYVPAHRHLAYALLRQGDLKGARVSFEQVLVLEPDAKDADEIRAMVRSFPQ